MGVYKPYSIVTPPFEVLSGGIRVMYGLYGWLLAKGQLAYLNATFEHPDFVAVYPEIYEGNPAGSGHVVRYILQTPGVMKLYGVQGPTEFPKGDKKYVFSKIYDTIGVDDDHIMFLPILNMHLFKDLKKKRKKTCYLVNKGQNQHKHPKNSIHLNKETSIDQSKLALILNECHTMYCYDRLSAMMEIARLCGCRVKYYGNFTKDDLTKYEPGMNGVTFKEEEDVKLDVGTFREHYKGLITTFDKKLDKFIIDTQK